MRIPSFSASLGLPAFGLVRFARWLLVVGFGLSALGSAVWARTEHVSTGSFLVGKETRFRVEAPTGSITLRYAEVPSIMVRLVEQFPTEDEAAWPALRESYEIGLVRDGNQVILVYRPRSNAVAKSGLIVARFEIVLPESVPAGLRVTTGNVNVDGVARSGLNVVAEGGAISLGTIVGELTVQTTDGTTVARVAPEAKDVRVRSDGGDVWLGLDPAGGFGLTVQSILESGETVMPAVEYGRSTLAPAREYGGMLTLRRHMVPPPGGSISFDGLKLKVRERSRTFLMARFGDGKTRVFVTSNGGNVRLEAAAAAGDTAGTAAP